MQSLFLIYVFMAQQPLVGQWLLIMGTLRSHLDTQHSVGLLWMSDQPETSAWQYTTITRDRIYVWFEHAIPGSELPRTHALDRAGTGIGSVSNVYTYY